VEQRLKETISSYQEEMVDITKQLIAIPTENPPGRFYRTCADLIVAKLDEIGLPSTLIEAPDVVPGTTDTLPSSEEHLSGYCLQSFHGNGTKTLYFHGHYDVVPANEQQFHPYMRGGSLFGRGSADMKGGLVAMIYAVKAIKACEIDLNGRIGLSFVPDEETGGRRGSQYLLDQGLLGQQGIGMLTAEPTGGVIWNANRGAISLRITVKGKPAHVGLHYQGINAFEQMLVVAQALQDLKKEVASRKTACMIEPEAARTSILMMGGQSASGTNFNVVPATCTFTVDRRINPEEDLEEEKQRLLSVLEDVKRSGVDLDIEIFQEARSCMVPEEDALAHALASSIRTITGKSPTFAMCPGLLEIRFYAQMGIPAFAYSPGLLSVAHGPHEFIKVKDITEMASVYALTAVRMLG
jgi:succinyl-diaminopimelate desuccinylase